MRPLGTANRAGLPDAVTASRPAGQNTGRGRAPQVSSYIRTDLGRRHQGQLCHRETSTRNGGRSDE